MNESEKDRILRMVSEGTLRPSEASHLLAALAEEPAVEEKPSQNGKTKAKPKQETVEVQMERPDGTKTTIHVSPTLGPMILQMIGVAIRESARSTAREAWSGFKTVVHNKTEEVKTNVRSRVAGGKTEETAPSPSPTQAQQLESRRLILQMVQNGRISASDASRLIQELDALQEYQQTHPIPPTPPAPVSK
jgi:polyhydroxyalkanoate synthesis regulator phasin